MSGGTGAYTYDWEDGQTSATVTDLVASPTYCVTVWDWNYCNSYNCYEIIDPPTSIEDINSSKPAITTSGNAISIRSTNGQVDVFNTLGNKVHSSNLNAGNNEISIDTKGIIKFISPL